MRFASIISEMLAFIVSLMVLKKNKGAFIQWMGLYLLFTIFIELAGYYCDYYLHRANSWFYLWHSAATRVIYTVVFFNLFNKLKLLKVFVLSVSSVLIISYVTIFFWVSNYTAYLYRLQIAQGVYLSLLSVSYLYREFINDSLEEYLVLKPGFWIAAGLLLFYSGFCIVMALHPSTYKTGYFIYGMPLHHFFLAVLSIILYVCISMAMVVWTEPNKVSPVANN
jgi:hypothetical protein